MVIEKFEDGPIWTIGYLVYDEESKETMVIDVPMWSSEKIYRRIRHLGLRTKYIVATHGHWDHIGEMEKLADLTGAEVCAHLGDEWLMRDPNGTPIPPPEQVEPVGVGNFLEERVKLQIGKTGFSVIHTPGHSVGSICLYADGENVIFTGDTLFAGSIGRTDLPTGSIEEISRSISEKIMSLPDDVRVFPGHGPESTLKKERAENQFVQMIFAEKESKSTTR
ncbi:MAG: MBL fold metallo-hydrolase [Bacteroidetes bacterium]|nr:MBL fold metallo-hydrolase [Bacteroidota bacterium]MCL5267786.1 MBL fold metallo-hydrolase [Bacteroidota bacterium]